MLERKGYPPGVPCWIDIAQPDPVAAVRYYAGVFGWEFDERIASGADTAYSIAKMRGRDVAAVGPSRPGGTAPAWNTYIRVDSVDATVAKVTGAGGAVLLDPVDVGDAGEIGRMATCADPDGAAFSVWAAGSRQGAELVNEASTWNWSDLHTRDPDRAATFYGDVFGWRAVGVDLGFGNTMMWCRPGYAEFLEQYDPGLRKRHADSGAPPEFSDSIGWLLPLDDAAGADALPYWHVTFSVDDTDGAVARSSALGGETVTAPFDAGPVRMAVLRDPQGAVFTVSRYSPSA
jgi:uncharacterized protein